MALLRRHNGCDGVSNHQPRHCLLNRSGVDQRKHQSYVSLPYGWGIIRWPMNSQHKWPVTRKMFPFDDVIMDSEKDPPFAHVTLFSFLRWDSEDNKVNPRYTDSTVACNLSFNIDSLVNSLLFVVWMNRYIKQVYKNDVTNYCSKRTVWLVRLMLWKYMACGHGKLLLQELAWLTFTKGRAMGSMTVVWLKLFIAIS